MGRERRNAYYGINLPVALMQSMKPADTWCRESDIFDVFEDGPYPCFSIRLREDVDPTAPLQATYTVCCMDNNSKPILHHTFDVMGSSALQAIQLNLRTILKGLFHRDVDWLFGVDALPLRDRYLHVPEDTRSVAQKMVDSLTAHPVNGKPVDRLFKLATQRGCPQLENTTPSILVRLLDRTNSDFPLSVETICSIGPEFIDIRPVAGADMVSGVAAVLDGVLNQVATTLSYLPKPFQPIGFWRREDIFQSLKELQCGSCEASRHMVGSGLLFAYTLQKMFGYDVECLCEPPEFEGEPWFCRITHAYCVDNEYLIDIRGIGTLKKRDDFFAHWEYQMLPMRETLVLSCDAMEDAICRGSNNLTESAAIAQFVREYCEYYDTGLLPHSVRTEQESPYGRSFEPCGVDVIPF